MTVHLLPYGRRFMGTGPPYHKPFQEILVFRFFFHGAWILGRESVVLNTAAPRQVDGSKSRHRLLLTWNSNYWLPMEEESHFFPFFFFFYTLIYIQPWFIYNLSFGKAIKQKDSGFLSDYSCMITKRQNKYFSESGLTRGMYIKIGK